MSSPRFFDFQCYRGVPCVFMARVRLSNGDLAKQSSFDVIKAAVYAGAEATPGFTDDLDPAAVMFNSLQGTVDDPDPRWQPEFEGESGYNFLWECPAAAFPDAAFQRVEIIYQLSNAVQGIAVFEGASRSTNA